MKHRLSIDFWRRTLVNYFERVNNARLPLQTALLLPFLEPSTLIVDVGCGSGTLVAYLQQLGLWDVAGLDIVNTSTKNIPFRLFDGITMPFENRSIDYVILSFVLHHSQDPFRTCVEALRVTRRAIFVFEDIPSTIMDRIMLAMHISFYSSLYRIPLPNQHPWHNSYLAALSELASHIHTEAIVTLPTDRRLWPYPMTRCFYVLRPQG